MVKKFSSEFKQQSVDYALSNAHFSITKFANHLGVLNGDELGLQCLRVWGVTEQ